MFAWIKNNVLKTVAATLLTGVLLSGAYWVGNTFKAGYKIEQREFIKSVLVDLMLDKDQMDVFVGKALASDTLKIVREVSNNNIIKAVAELSEGDSINLRKELRLYMDLKESQTVSKEIGRMYIDINRLPFLVDSIIYSTRRRTRSITL
jgi:coenzyme F420-reducing hydrogenase delta subunit